MALSIKIELDVNTEEFVTRLYAHAVKLETLAGAYEKALRAIVDQAEVNGCWNAEHQIAQEALDAMDAMDGSEVRRLPSGRRRSGHCHRTLDRSRSNHERTNMLNVLNAQTQIHIGEVQRLIRLFATELLKRGEQHDQSKHSIEEADVFNEYSGKLKTLTYGSDEYKACLAAMKPALDHHYQVNRHHPEHFNEGLFGMNLLDLVEMFLDWYAASKRHADGNIYESLDKNFERFSMSVQLKSILVNTADLVTQDMDHSCGNCSGRNFGTETQGQCRATSAVVMNTDGERCLAWGRAVYPKD